MNTIGLTANEASLLIAAVHDALLRSIRWSIGPEGSWRSVPLEDAQNYIQTFAVLHSKIWMVLKDYEEPEHSFEKAFMIPDIVWDVVDGITTATSWDQVDKHLHSPTLCKACRFIYTEAKQTF